MEKAFRIEMETILPVPAETLWRDIMSMKGVNDELFPLARMTFPGPDDDYSLGDAPVREVLFMSVILGLTILPIDFHYLRFDRILDGRGFEENSTSLAHRFWRHTRTLEPAGAETRLRDVVWFRPRVFAKGYLLQPVYAFVFRHRHRRLQRRYGTPES